MKYIITFLLLTVVAFAAAEPHFYPLTTLAEDVSANWCGGCTLAFQGMEVVHEHTHPGELITTRLYTESGDLSSPSVDARISHYEVFGIPVLFFNGKTRIDGSGDGIADGSVYRNAIKPYLHGASPLKMEVTDFNPANGRVSGYVEMLDPAFNIQNQNLILYLVENNVTATDTYVTRQVITIPISLTGLGEQVFFDQFFTVNPAWNAANLWAAAFVQMTDNAIIQTAHTQAKPDYNFRCAFPWDANLVAEIGQPFASEPLWFFNLGLDDDYFVSIVVDNAPADWVFNYCDEEGNCYPGFLQLPVSMASGEAKAYHLNLWVPSSGIAEFHYEITSTNLGTYSVPFRVRTSDIVSNHDPLAPAAALRLLPNAPNPFRSSTRLTVISDKANSEATVDIYDIKGRKVDSITIANLNAGENTLKWIPKADLPSGIYFQRLKGYPNTTRKMILTK